MADLSGAGRSRLPVLKRAKVKMQQINFRFRVDGVRHGNENVKRSRFRGNGESFLFFSLRLRRYLRNLGESISTRVSLPFLCLV